MSKQLKMVFGLFLTLFMFGNLYADGCAWHKKDTRSGSAAENNVIKTGEQEKAPTDFTAISQADLVKAIETKAVFLVDANSEESYRSGHLPGAVHFDSPGFKKRLPKDKSALIVAYCGGPGCEAWCRAAEDLDKKGYKNIRHYKGGLKEWKTAGLKLEKKNTNEG